MTTSAKKQRPAAPATRVVRLDPDELAALEEQRDFLLTSLADLEREHDAGDLEDDDYETLRDDYTSRAAEVLRAIDEKRQAFEDARKPRSVGRTFAVVAAVALFAIVSGVLVANAMGARKAGESASGGVSVEQSTSQRANECANQMSSDPEESYSCLEGVLEDDPENAVALTWSAWLLSISAPNFEGGERIAAQARAAVRLEQAVESDPDYSYARAFRAIVAYRNGRFEDAKQYLADFEDHDPSAQAAQVIEQQGLAEKIEAALAAEATTSTTTTPSTTTTVAGG